VESDGTLSSAKVARMQAIAPEGLETSLTSDGSTDEKIDTLVEVVQSQLVAIEELQQENKRLQARLDETDEDLTQTRERAQEAEAKVEELQAELKEERETRGKESAEDRQRIHRVEERLDSMEEGGSGDETPTPQAEETTIQEPETPLEDVIRVPEQVAEENLSANQQRARFVAKDIHEYSRSVPAGRVIKSSELRRVLSAKKEGRVYTETVSRVIEFLTKLGEESVKVRETQQGERVVVFTDGFVKRVVAYHNQHNRVVTERGATG